MKKGLSLATLAIVLGCTNGVPVTSLINNEFNGGGVNLEVPIEMVDANIESQPGMYTSDRSLTSLDTNDYNGFVSYGFEVSALNNDISDQTIEIVDSANNQKGLITVPGSTVTYKRQRVVFSPNSGNDNYRLRLSGTAVGNTLKIGSARMIVRQYGATKTAIYVPMFSGRNIYAGGNAGTDVGILFTSSNSYNQPTNFLYWSQWKKDPTVFGGFDPSTSAFTFEAVAYCGSCTGYLSLFNHNTGTQVTPSEVSFTGGTPTLKQATFLSTAPAFTDLNAFDVRMKSDGTNFIQIDKAGLWIKLSALTKGEVYYKIAQSMNSPSTWSGNRTMYDASAFTSPHAFFEITGSTGSGTTYSLFDFGLSDTSNTGSVVVASAIGSPGSQLIVRSSELTLTSTNRYGLNYSLGGNNFISGHLVVQFGQ